MSLTLLGQFCWCRLSMKVASTHWNCSVTRIIQTSLPVSDSTLVSIWITSTRRQEWCIFPSSLYIQFSISYLINWFLVDSCQTLEHSLIQPSTGNLVGSWLLCIQNFSWLIRFGCMLGVDGEVWIKNFLYWFIDGHTHFGMLRDAQMSWTLNEPL